MGIWCLIWRQPQQHWFSSWKADINFDGGQFEIIYKNGILHWRLTIDGQWILKTAARKNGVLHKKAVQMNARTDYSSIRVYRPLT